IALNVGIHFVLVVTVIAQGIKDLREREVGKTSGNFLWRNAHPPQLNNRSHRSTSVLDDGLAAEDTLIPDNITMLRRHYRMSFIHTRFPTTTAFVASKLHTCGNSLSW